MASSVHTKSKGCLYCSVFSLADIKGVCSSQINLIKLKGIDIDSVGFQWNCSRPVIKKGQVQMYKFCYIGGVREDKLKTVRIMQHTVRKR